MNNIEIVTSLCTAMCSSFYPDKSVVTVSLFEKSIDPYGDAVPKDKEIFKIAVALIKGYVENSRSEGGFSVSVDQNSVDDAIKFWCEEYDVPIDDVLKVKTIEDASSIW